MVIDRTKKSLATGEEHMVKGYATETFEHLNSDVYIRYPRWLKPVIFLFLVILPSCIFGIYFIGIASDQYISEVRFVVRTIGLAQVDNDDQSKKGGTIVANSVTQDTFIAANFVESIELVERLEAKIGLRKMFSRPDIDYFSRLKEDAKAEELFDFWKGQIYTYVDGPSGIVVLRLRAFTPEDSILIAETVLQEITQLVDALSDRAKSDLVQRAELEVEKSFEKYNKALTALRNYQNETGILNPISNATLVGEILASLLEEKLRIEAELAVAIQSGVTNSPKQKQLLEMQEALSEQINIQKASIAGQTENTGKLSGALVEFSRLETDRLINEALYEASSKNLDLAKSTALRRTTYLAIFSAPKKPEISAYPKRYSVSFLIILAFFVIWSIVMLSWASIDDHRN